MQLLVYTCMYLYYFVYVCLSEDRSVCTGALQTTFEGHFYSLKAENHPVESFHGDTKEVAGRRPVKVPFSSVVAQGYSVVKETFAGI